MILLTGKQLVILQMRKIFFYIVLLSSITACNNEAGSEDAADTLTEEVILLPEEKLIWTTAYDSLSGNYLLKQQREADTDSLTAPELIAGINAVWENVQLEFIKISNDSIYTTIPNSEFLTQRMGSAGAAEYMAVSTYNLTELKNIRFVNYAFEEGDHAAPGTFSREDFRNFRQQ